MAGLRAAGLLRTESGVGAAGCASFSAISKWPLDAPSLSTLRVHGDAIGRTRRESDADARRAGPCRLRFEIGACATAAEPSRSAKNARANFLPRFHQMS